MTKKKSEKKDSEVRFSEAGHPVLTNELFWEWNCAVEQVQSHELKIKIAAYESKLIEKEIELLQSKLRDSRRSAKSVVDEKSVVEKSYRETLSKVEEYVGFSMSNCAVHPHTLEVQRLDK